MGEITRKLRSGASVWPLIHLPRMPLNPRRWLEDVLRGFDGPGGLSEPAGGLGFPLMLLLIPLLPLPLGGIVRAAASANFAVGAITGAVVTTVIVAAVVAARPGRIHDFRLAVQTTAMLAVLVGGTFVVLWGGALDGLVTSGAWDAGNHLNLRRMFIEQDPGTYEKFVSFYAFTHGLEVLLGLDAFESFRAAFYAIPVAIIVCILAGHAEVAGSMSRDHHLATRTGQVVLGFLAAGAGWVFILPLLHYHQADGFFAHLFGLIPLIAGMMHYALVRRRALRVTVLLGWVVLQRFTYGLNLGDAVGTAAILVAVEGAQLRHSQGRRFILFGLAATILAGMVYVCAALSILVTMEGGFLKPGLRYMLLGELLLSALCAVLPSVARRVGGDLGRVGERLARYAAAFGIVNVGIHVVVIVVQAPQEYYFLKYHLYGVVITAVAGLVLVAALAGRALTLEGTRARNERLLALAAAVVLGLAMLAFGFACRPYYPSFRDRLQGTPPWRSVFPLAERAGWDRIETTLEAERCAFGGLLAPSMGKPGASLGQSHFTNAALGLPGYWTDAPHRLLAGQVVPKADYCIFWYSGERHRADYERFQRRWGGGMADAVRALDALPHKRCQEYPAPWDPGVSLRLCHASGISITDTLEGAQ
jgi:hypothetical protein